MGRGALARDGASAIEFALVFPLFFLMFYALVNYGLILALNAAMTVAASEGARSAVAADPRTPDYPLLVTERARASVARVLDWLPPVPRDIVLGAENGNVSVDITDDPSLGSVVTVEIRYDAYPSNPLLPLLRLPGLGAIPPVPERLVARSTAQL